MAAPTPKRRKLDSALTKPFKSPVVRRPAGAAPPAQQAHSSTATASTTASSTAPNPAQQAHTSAVTASRPGPAAPKDASLAALRSALAARQRELAQVTQALDTARQARRLQGTRRDTQLAGLAGRWRAAAREAAAEVFGAAKDRVNGMGGLGAWREREREMRRGWEEDEERRGGRDDEGEREEREHDEGGRGDQEFTMDVMLASLNIDLGLIGYDGDRQCWTD